MHSYALVTAGDSPYDEALFKPASMDGPRFYSPLLITSDMVVETKAPGLKLLAADQSHGKLSYPNPLFTVPGAPHNSTWFDDINYRNRAREIRDQLQNHTTDVRFTGQYHKRTPIATPNTIPAFYFHQ